MAHHYKVSDKNSNYSQHLNTGANQNQLCGQFVYYQESSRINIHDLEVNGKCIDTVLEETRYDSIRHFELSLYSLGKSNKRFFLNR